VFDLDNPKKKDPSETEKLLAELTPQVVIMSYKLARGRNDLREDLAQEGLMALAGAAANYDGEKGASFTTFALVCARNRMIDALRRLTKHDGRRVDPYSFGSAEEAGDMRDRDVIESRKDGGGIETKPLGEADVVEQIMRRDILRSLPEILSAAELKAFLMKMRGASYAEIAACMSVGEKAVDNALARARKKIFALYNAG